VTSRKNDVISYVLRTCVVIGLLGIDVQLASAQIATTPSASRVYSTIYSIGVEWDVVGDTNHDAVAAVAYRVYGTTAWTAALPLVRVDSTTGGNMLAGSILFLTPDTAYDVRLSLSDPDGGAETRIVNVTTRALPTLPAAGRTFHVVPGTGGGDGSEGNPFRGVPAAQSVAQPGDTMLLHAGSYGGRIRFDKPGTATGHLVWKGAGDGETVMNGIDIAASHIWLEGLTVRNQQYATFSIAAPDDVVVRRCSFYNNHYSIYLQQGGSNWYIADNIIVGDTAYQTESFDGEGIELNQSGGHTVAHNSITNVADGISYPLRNVDIFGNDIFDTSDDGVEADYGYANVRIWGNRIHNAVHNGISFQPQNGAPWYIIRNQIVSSKEAAFKFRTTDRFVLVHNTIVNWGSAWPGDAMICCNEDHLLRSRSRNNLWISVQGGQIWGFDAFTKDWRSDLDYDGFDWGSATNPFSYGGAVHPDLGSFAAASGLERNGLAVSKSACFETFDVPNPPMNPVPPQTMTLKAGCNAIDTGAVLANINDGTYIGLGPDLGAYEFGAPAPAYGPRVPPTARLTVSPPTIAAGETATLTWTTTDAVTVSLDPSIGSVTPSGAQQIAPASTTTYTVTAAGPNGVATASATLTVAATLPSAPSNLVAQTVSSTRINLAWTDSADNETGFTIERSSDGISFAQVMAVPANTTAWADTGLIASTTYHYRLSSYNGAGASAYSNSASATTAPVPIVPPTVVLWTATVKATNVHGNWKLVRDKSAAGSAALSNPDARQPKISPALAAPANYFEATFKPAGATAYRVWVRLKAQKNALGNDSVHLQFSDSVTSSGIPIHRIGSTSSLAYILQAGSSDTGNHGWGWADNGWDEVGVPVYFATSGTHRLRVQQREDGAIVDQIVLSPDTYLSAPPGPRDNDATILPANDGSQF
jgi:hypothetical protein